ncbi:hypothetical protein CYLTODRAFT_423273 [Cylindrobasidium torrendii FP15055 ss-10]|uniref:Yeast cell wall synthesis Kre9/Knh1-like N-terminal domain-containing protein n=1 Tax=Cylindrobasidium torrendii FP15055 ss-10 TaxID=1314674 RepID=A0A0D7B8W2_9AGAR|nr:hypothetical protein CYLTODRAFT_423273 [Cylindrobasidium torrendii FP15055 ss-10]
MAAFTFNFASMFVLFASMFAMFVNAIPVGLVGRDVYVPPVTSPAADTVWTVNSTATITWDTSSPPEQITNKVGRVFLRKGDRTLPLLLADGFDILDGSVDITVPWVLESGDYQVVLFGDSGNFSPNFTITGGPPY